MMKISRTIFLLSLFLTACVPELPPTLPSPTAPTATTVMLPAPTELVLPAPSELPTETPVSLEFSPILYRRYLSRYFEFQVVGGLRNGRWLTVKEVVDDVQPGQVFDIYAPYGSAGTASIVDYGFHMEPSMCGTYYVGSDFAPDVPNIIGVGQGWSVTYRPWQELSVDIPLYQQFIADWLISQGIAQPDVQINHIVRVDMEGDGVDEVFITASRFLEETGHMTEYGDYSIILMRKVVGDIVVPVPIVADVYISSTPEITFPFTYSFANLLDLNQDGILEVIVEVARWEGNGVIIYRVDGVNVTQTLMSVCTE
jgi:hypothetical protein